MVAEAQQAETAPIAPRRARQGRASGSAALLPTAALRVGGLAASGLLLLAAVLLSLAVGTASIDLGEVVRAIVAYEQDSREHIIVRETRLDRTLIAVAVGAAFAVSGALMQAVTRNPLADPGILGVNAGAALAIVLAVSYLGIADPSAFVWLALAGAGLAAVLVYLLGTGGREPSTLKLALAGATFAALVGALTSALVVVDAYALDMLRFWLVGSVAGRQRETLLELAPFLAAGFVLALALARPLNALALGDDVARSLGQRVALVRGTSALAAVLLAGASVALAGPIAFVGLIVPHIVRALVGPDHRWLLVYCAGLGASLLLVSDVIGRLLVKPDELEVGIVIALVGAPFFIYLARTRNLTEA